MKRNEIKLNRMVIDRWWPEWGCGKITDVKKTVFTVDFDGNKLKYDYPHAQFLEFKS